MDASNKDIEMTEISIQSRLQTPIEVEESEPFNPDQIVVEVEEAQDDSDGPNNDGQELKVVIGNEGTNQKKWFR